MKPYTVKVTRLQDQLSDLEIKTRPLTLTGARGKRSSRYHPGSLALHNTNLFECLGTYMSASTLAYNEANRHSL